MKRASGFTLIELLTVIVIAGIMMGIGVLSFTRLSKGTKLQTAGSNLVNTMEMARQYAITHRVTTLVVFPLDRSQPTTNIAPPYISYAVAVTPDGNSGEDEINTNCTYLTDWRKLPDGIVLDFTKWNYMGQWSEGDPLATGSVPGQRGIRTGTINIPNGAVNVNQRAGFIHFAPSYYQAYNVFLREGTIDPATGLPVLTPPGTVTNANFFEVVVAWPTGRIFTRKK